MKPFNIQTKSLHDMRTAYRAECTTCGRGGAWLTDRSVVVRNAEAHQNSEHVSQEAVAS